LCSGCVDRQRETVRPGTRQRGAGNEQAAARPALQGRSHALTCSDTPTARWRPWGAVGEIGQRGKLGFHMAGGMLYWVQHD